MDARQTLIIGAVAHFATHLGRDHQPVTRDLSLLQPTTKILLRHPSRIPVYFEYFIDSGEQIDKLWNEYGGKDFFDFDWSRFKALADWYPCPTHTEDNSEYDMYTFYWRAVMHCNSMTQQNPYLDECGQEDPNVYAVQMHVDTAKQKGIADGDKIWTYKQAMVPETLPKSILVIGSGAIGGPRTRRSRGNSRLRRENARPPTGPPRALAREDPDAGRQAPGHGAARRWLCGCSRRTTPVHGPT